MTAAAVVDGFTAQEDRVAYLLLRNGRVTKMELRHQYHIQNPAEAINASEAKYKFRVETGETLPNNDVPYTLVEGSIPAISGTMPLFNQEQIEAADSGVYVAALDLYQCTQCKRHPVYVPTPVEEGYAGVCPRHGRAIFAKFA